MKAGNTIAPKTKVSRNLLISVVCAVALFWLISRLLNVFSFGNDADFKGHPTDQVLSNKFQSHKKDFTKLLGMFVSDKQLERIAYDFTRPENPRSIGITEERLSEYRALFDKLGLSQGIEGYDAKNTIWFHASAQGLSVTGSGKGYVYLKHKPTVVVADLDKYWSKDGKSFTAYKRLQGDWYLYFDYED